MGALRLLPGSFTQLVIIMIKAPKYNLHVQTY